MAACRREMQQGKMFSQMSPVVSNCLQTHRKRLCGSRTSALWLQYMHMIDIMRKSIKAERTGNFKMHLESVKDILPFLAAAGHQPLHKIVLALSPADV